MFQHQTSCVNYLYYSLPKAAPTSSSTYEQKRNCPDQEKKNLKTEVYDRFQSLASLVSSAMLRVFKLEYTMHLCSCTYNLPGIIATLLLTRLVVFTHAQLRERNNGEIIKTAATMKYLGATLMQGMSLRAGT